MKRIVSPLLLILLSSLAFSDTPPPGTVAIKGGTDGTKIGNVTDSLKVNVTNSISATVSGPVAVTQSTSPWLTSRNWTLSSGTDSCSAVQSGSWTTGRTWTLSSGTDSVNVGNFPASFAVTQSTSPWVTSVSNFPATQPISAISLPLPAGASTSALQTSGNSSLSSIDGKLNSLGQKTMANSVPVVISSDQSPISITGSITATNSANGNTGSAVPAQATQVGGSDGVNLRALKVSSTGVVSVDGSATTQPVSGTVTANAGTGNFTVVQPTGTNLHAVLDTTSTTAVTQATAANLNATVVQASGANLHVNVDSAPTTTVTGTVTANQGTSPWVTSVSNFPATQAVTQSGTWNVGLNAGANTIGKVDQGTGGASAWKVDGSAVTQPVSGTVAVTQSTSPWVSNISQFGGSAVVTGTGASGAGIPRVTVSNDSNILATQSGTWNINNISGTVSLPTGAATSANQTTVGNQTTKINDGTNTAAVKAASTAPAATDPALVVALSPNGNQAKDSSITGLQVTQGSTTSGQSGTLVQGAVTTNSPSYTTAQTSPLSLNVRGGLRSVVVGGDASQIIRNDYSSTNVTTAAYVQLVASTANNINRLYIFDSSGQDFVLATGAAASEVDQIAIPPGGIEAPVDLFIPSGTRISIKSKSATASSGLLIVTGLK